MRQRKEDFGNLILKVNILKKGPQDFIPEVFFNRKFIGNSFFDDFAAINFFINNLDLFFVIRVDNIK